MRVYQRDYFDRFHCLAADCPDSCCKEWDVQVDAQSAKVYRALPGPLGDRLRQVLTDDPEYGTVMTIENGRCPMWRSDGLCQIQAELGHSALCKTCRDFPRLTHDYGDFMELGLELSCPEAARLILTSSPSPLQIHLAPGEVAPEYDRDAMQILLKTRETALGIVSDPTYSIEEVLVLLLFYGYHAQSALDGDDAGVFCPDAALEEAAQIAGDGDKDSFLAFYADLELLTDTWAARLRSPSAMAGESEMFRNLARYGIERYWLQAVCDYDLVSRVKMVVASCLLVKELGGDTIATAQLYSKEVENNADNVDAILDGAYAHPALTDQNLIGLLLTHIF